MMIHRRAHRLVPLLALSVTLAVAASVQAQERHDQGSGGPSVSLQINFGTAPHWEGIRGTRVQAIRREDRTDYDMFHYGSYYYVYNNSNDRWYRARRWRGRFMLIEDRLLPRELRKVPREHWRNYPSAWQNQDHGQKGTPPGLENKGGNPPGQEKKNRGR